MDEPKKKTELAYGTAVLVEWQDIKSLLGWSYSHKEPPRKPGYIKSIGFLSDTNLECITLTTSMDDKEASLDDVSIPLGCITKITVLPEEFSRKGEAKKDDHKT